MKRSDAVNIIRNRLLDANCGLSFERSTKYASDLLSELEDVGMLPPKITSAINIKQWARLDKNTWEPED